MAAPMPSNRIQDDETLPGSVLIPEDYDITQDTYYYPWMIAQENGLSRPLLAKDVIRIYRWAIGRDIKALNVWAARVAPVMGQRLSAGQEQIRRRMLAKIERYSDDPRVVRFNEYQRQNDQHDLHMLAAMDDAHLIPDASLSALGDYLGGFLEGYVDAGYEIDQSTIVSQRMRVSIRDHIIDAAQHQLPHPKAIQDCIRTCRMYLQIQWLIFTPLSTKPQLSEAESDALIKSRNTIMTKASDYLVRRYNAQAAQDNRVCLAVLANTDAATLGRPQTWADLQSWVPLF